MSNIVECEPLSDGKMLVLQKVGRRFTCYITSPAPGEAPTYLERDKSRRLAYAAFEQQLKEDTCDTT